MIPQAHHVTIRLCFQRFCIVVVVCSINFLLNQPMVFSGAFPPLQQHSNKIFIDDKHGDQITKSCKTPLQQCHRHHRVPQTPQRLHAMPKVVVEGSYDDDNLLLEDIIAALHHCGFDTTLITTPPQQQRHDDDQEDLYYVYKYKFVKATGMLQLVRQPPPIATASTLSSSSAASAAAAEMIPPKWIPIVKGMELVLVSNGWSFLDPDPSEPESPFHFDIHGYANNIHNHNNNNNNRARRGQYIPPWHEQPS